MAFSAPLADPAACSRLTIVLNRSSSRPGPGQPEAATLRLMPAATPASRAITSGSPTNARGVGGSPSQSFAAAGTTKPQDRSRGSAWAAAGSARVSRATASALVSSLSTVPGSGVGAGVRLPHQLDDLIALILQRRS